MKVYLCYNCYYNYCDEFNSVVKIVDCEEKALIWKEEFKATETEWREYEEREVE